MSNPDEPPNSEPLYRQLAAEWRRSDSPPDVIAFLHRHAHASADEQAAVIMVDQHQRWQRGVGRPVEAYLKQMPALAENNQVKLDLIAAEFGCLEEQGLDPNIDSYLMRFPELRDVLRSDVFDGMVEKTRTQISKDPAFEADAGFALQDAVRDATPISHSVEHGRFLPGARIADRYRIVSLLGYGGMGDVYRADDLKLGQRVALKFLPRHLDNDPQLLEYFHTEVRLARQITHPNVCRVYDIGEVDGQHFLSMEYIDGEDLRGLLRRIGRLPRDKGIEIAAQLSAGLAAAHDMGVLHRDLKPANIMIDGRGQVRITDFGLAKLAADDATREIVGTPKYMAPEQLKRGETSQRSDVYSLGLILYEIFTGQRALSQDGRQELLQFHQDSSLTPPSQLVDDMGAAVENVILSCLQPDPQQRLSSARAVAVALPGGNPLMAMVAAGETPSPEMVAGATENSSGLRPRTAAACFSGLIAVLALIMLVSTALLRPMQLAEPSRLLFRAQEIIDEFGWTRESADSASGFWVDPSRRLPASELQQFPNPFQRIATYFMQQSYFWSRQSPELLVTDRETLFGLPFFLRISEDNPMALKPGMVGVRLDHNERMIEFNAVPTDTESPSDDDPISTAISAEQPIPWSVLCERSGIPESLFTNSKLQSVAPIWIPLGIPGRREAWIGQGVFEERSNVQFRIEAAATEGQPVFFRVAPWADNDKVSTSSNLTFITPALFTLLLAGAVGLAWRNLRIGRGDRRGTIRIGAVFFGLWLVSCLLFSSHVQHAYEFVLLNRALARALYLAICVSLFYLALEPLVRKLWPETLIGWSRLILGRRRDPRVGRDILFGTLGGALCALFAKLSLLGNAAIGQGVSLNYLDLNAPIGVSLTMGTMLYTAAAVIFGCLIFDLFLLMTLRLVLRKTWLASGVFIVLRSAIMVASLSSSWLFIPIIAAIILFTLIRFGFLAVLCLRFVMGNLEIFPITADATWFAWPGWVLLCCVLLLGAYGFYTALGGRRLMSNALLEGG